MAAITREWNMPVEASGAGRQFPHAEEAGWASQVEFANEFWDPRVAMAIETAAGIISEFYSYPNVYPNVGHTVAKISVK